MQRKKGISLIVLVITIIVMIILAGAIIITLNNSGIIDKASQAVDKTNEATMKEVADVAWAEAYAEGVRTVEDTTGPNGEKILGFQSKVDEALENNNVDTTGYNIIATTTGTIIEKLTEPEQPLTPEEYNQKYANEIAMALKYGTVTNGTYMLKDEYFVYGGGSSLPEEAYVLALPYGTTTVGGGCFAMQSITKIILPETTIKVADYGFDGCTNLKEVEGFEYIEDIDDYGFNNTSIENIKIGKKLYVSRGNWAGGAQIKNVEILHGVEELTAGVLQGTGVESVYIPKSVIKIGQYAFYNTPLKTVYYAGTEAEWNNITIEEGEPGSNAALTNANIVYNYTGE